MSTTFLRYLTPQAVNGCGRNGDSLLRGHVVDVADVAGLPVTEVARTFGAYDGSAPYVDRVVFDVGPSVELQRPFADDHARYDVTAAGVRQPPQAGGRVGLVFPSGLLRIRGAVPVWEVAPTRMPIGARLERVAPNGQAQLLSRYRGPAYGWGGASGYQPPTELVGLRAHWRGSDLPAALCEDGSTVELVAGEEADGFAATWPGVFRRVVDRSDLDALFSVEVTAVCRGHRVRILQPGAEQVTVQLLEPTAAAIAATGAAPIDPDVFEAVVAPTDLSERQIARRDYDVQRGDIQRAATG